MVHDLSLRSKLVPSADNFSTRPYPPFHKLRLHQPFILVIIYIPCIVPYFMCLYVYTGRTLNSPLEIIKPSFSLPFSTTTTLGTYTQNLISLANLYLWNKTTRGHKTTASTTIKLYCLTDSSRWVGIWNFGGKENPSIFTRMQL